MTSKVRRALKATLAVTACAALIFSVAGMTACSSKIRGHATQNMYEAPAEDAVPEDCSGTLKAVAYMNYTLAQKSSWHAYKETNSHTTALGITADDTTTKTQKDYKDGILVAEESVYSTAAGTSSHQFMFYTGSKEDEDAERIVYVRSGDGPSSEDKGKTVDWTVMWDDETEPECWTEDYYNKQYGLFMDEMSLYVVNDETAFTLDEDGEVESNGCGDVIKNADGTYSQTFVLDTEISTYYYQYSMMTHGGLGNNSPKFSSVEVTFKFNSNWEILELYEEDSCTIFGISSCTSSTVTTYSYGEDDFDASTYSSATSFFEPYVGKIDVRDIEREDGEE